MSETVRVRAVLHFVSFLPHPLGINVTSRSGHRTPMPVQRWKRGAALTLAGDGFVPLPAGCYWVEMTQILRTQRHDIDAVSKIIIDTCLGALQINDARLGQLTLQKVHASSPEEEGVQVSVTVERVANLAAWRQRAEAAIQ
jgi:Holliday junction resolvase RusA-like endonuclease